MFVELSKGIYLCLLLTTVPRTRHLTFPAHTTLSRACDLSAKAHRSPKTPCTTPPLRGLTLSSAQKTLLLHVCQVKFQLKSSSSVRPLMTPLTWQKPWVLGAAQHLSTPRYSQSYGGCRAACVVFCLPRFPRRPSVCGSQRARFLVSKNGCV